MLTKCASAAEAPDSEAREWQAHGEDLGRHCADDHQVGWIGREELRHNVSCFCDLRSLALNVSVANSCLELEQ